MKQLKEIPTSIIMGFLGAGKSTAVTQLLRQKPIDEKWLVLVNEFGKVAVDQLLIKGDNNTLIKEVGGGCICCSANMLLKTTLVTSLRSFRPDRVIIEPTGLAHPRKIMEMLISDFSGVLTILSVATIIDPIQFTQEKYYMHQSYRDQLAIADTLICNKIDLADETQIAQVKRWSEEHGKAVYNVQYGDVKLGWFAKPHLNSPIATNKQHELQHNIEQQKQDEPQKGLPVFYEGSGLGYYSYGVIFAESERLDKYKVTTFINELRHIVRVKGIIQTERGSFSINILNEDQCSMSTIRSTQNRIEFISEAKIDKNQFIDGIEMTIV